MRSRLPVRGALAAVAAIPSIAATRGGAADSAAAARRARMSARMEAAIGCGGTSEATGPGSGRPVVAMPISVTGP